MKPARPGRPREESPAIVQKAECRGILLAPPAGRDDLPLGDNFALDCRYADGSLTQLLYLSVGHGGLGKERLELHWDGNSAVIDDFRRLSVQGPAIEPTLRDRPDKGHRELLTRFIRHAAGHGAAPIPIAELLDVSRFVLELEHEARSTGADPGV